MNRCSWIVVVGSVALAACSMDEIDGYRAGIAGEPADGLLDFMNDQENTTFELLDVTCRLRSDSARNLIKHRDGNDKLPFTSDDDLFDSYAEIDEVKMVGDWTLNQLTMCAWMRGYMKGVGPTLAGSGTALVDGYLGGNEWVAAATYDFEVQLPEGGSVPATLLVMNDANDVHFAVTLDAPLLDRMLRFVVLFDGDSDGFVASGDDRVSAVWSPTYGSTNFGDGHVGVPATVASDTIASFYYDTYQGGTAEGRAACGAMGSKTLIELSHPLDTADDSHDVSLSFGDDVAFSFAVAVLGDEWTETRGWASLAVTAPLETVPWQLPQNVLDDLAERAQGYAYPDVYFEMKLTEQFAFLQEGVPISYLVIFRQMIDPEGGIALWVEFELDADYNIVSETPII